MVKTIDIQKLLVDNTTTEECVSYLNRQFKVAIQLFGVAVKDQNLLQLGELIENVDNLAGIIDNLDKKLSGKKDASVL